MEDRICVGVIAGAFGVKGEVRLKSFTATPSDIAKYCPLSNEEGTLSFQVTLERPVKGGYAARLDGISDKEQADVLKGTRLFARREQLPSLPDDEFYHADLIGLSVLDTGGQALGRVISVLNHGAGDLLEIKSPGQKDTVLLPFTRVAVPTVDLAAGRIIADPPDGIF